MKFKNILFNFASIVSRIDAQRIENILKTFELVLIHSNGDNTMEDDSLLTVFLIFFKRFEPQIRSAIK